MQYSAVYESCDRGDDLYSRYSRFSLGGQEYKVLHLYGPQVQHGDALGGQEGELGGQSCHRDLGGGGAGVQHLRQVIMIYRVERGVRVILGPYFTN